MFFLSWGALFVGYLSKDFLASGGCSFWGYAIFIFPDNCSAFDSEFLPMVIKLVPVFCSICGAFFAFICYLFYSFFLFHFKFSVFGRHFYSFFNRKWLFDSIYCAFVNQSFFHSGFVGTYSSLDRGFFEVFGPKGSSYWVNQIGSTTTSFQTGYLVHYASVLLWSVIFITGLFLVYSLFSITSFFVELFLLLVFIVFFV